MNPWKMTNHEASKQLPIDNCEFSKQPHRRLYWELTTACQLRCKYCYYETDITPRHKGNLTPAVAAEVVIPRIRPYFREVMFTGGEVLLLPDFWRFVALVVPHLDVSFVTDGLRLGQEAIARVRDYPLSRIAVSLDSLDVNANDCVRTPNSNRIPGAKAVIENLRLLAGAAIPHLKISVLQTVHRQNINAIRPMVEFCRNLDVDLFVHPAGMPSVPHLSHLRMDSLTTEELSELEAAMLYWADCDEWRVRYVETAIAFACGLRPQKLCCDMGTSKFLLTVTGDIYPCFYRRDRLLGNIFRQSLDHILKTSPSAELATAPCAHLGCLCQLNYGPRLTV